ncbi:MAG: hypothetical protein ABGZ36_16005 [Actinomycetota bacterium]
MSAITSLLLRSPLHRLRSKSWAIVSVDGGEPAVVRYHRDGDRLVVLGGSSQDWWRSIPSEGSTTVTVRLAGTTSSGAASFLEGEALDEAMVAYLHTNPGAWAELGVTPTATGDDVAAAAREAAVVAIDLR